MKQVRIEVALEGGVFVVRSEMTEECASHVKAVAMAIDISRRLRKLRPGLHHELVGFSDDEVMS